MTLIINSVKLLLIVISNVISNFLFSSSGDTKRQWKNNHWSLFFDKLNLKYTEIVELENGI